MLRGRLATTGLERWWSPRTNVFSHEAQLLAVLQPVHTVPTMGAYPRFHRGGRLDYYGSDLAPAYRRVDYARRAFST